MANIKKIMDCDIKLHLQHSCSTFAQTLHIMYLCKYSLVLPELFYLYTNLAPKDDLKSLECKNSHAAAYMQHTCQIAAYCLK